LQAVAVVAGVQQAVAVVALGVYAQLLQQRVEVEP
jgi:hypothetical protein